MPTSSSRFTPLPFLSEVLPAVTAVRAVLGYTPIYSEDNLLQTAELGCPGARVPHTGRANIG